jgi:hypothetical protein
MLKKENLKSFIDELIKEVEKELDEANVTGNVDGYQTPFAFSGKNSAKQRKKTATQFGYTLVNNDINNIDESVNEEIKIQAKPEHWNERSHTILVTTAPNKTYVLRFNNKNDSSPFSVTFPGSMGTKPINTNKSAREFWLKVKGDVVKWRSTNESINEDFKHLIHVDTPTQVVSKPIAAQIVALAKKGVRSKDIGLEMGFVGNQKVATDAFQKIKNKIYFDLDKREGVNESLDPKASKFLDAIQVNDRSIKDLKDITVDTTPQGNWSVYHKGKRICTINGKMLDDRTIMKYGLEHMDESISEGKGSVRPVNRWLELKNDESMHANKKLAVGLKELKYQLKEVETFFRWYNQIKTMNELSSDAFWKRTHGHIYKIKERLINIAKTIQEIEK